MFGRVDAGPVGRAGLRRGWVRLRRAVRVGGDGGGGGEVLLEAWVAGASAAVGVGVEFDDLPVLELFEVDDGDGERGDDGFEGAAAVVVAVLFAPADDVGVLDERVGAFDAVAQHVAVTPGGGSVARVLRPGELLGGK